MIQAADNWILNQQDELIATLKEWSNINSGSFHVAGVERMAKVMQAYIQKAFNLSATQFSLPSFQQFDSSGLLIERPVGPLLKFSMRPEAKRRVLLCGHMDTVFPKESDFQEWHQIDNNTLGGPGVADMKGGILLMLTALQAFEKTETARSLGWDIILSPDEEIGSIGSARHLTKAAKSAQLGLVFEPSMPDGFLAGARRGSGNFTLIVHGKAAHAGREYHLGRNAIAALSSAMQELDRLNILRDTSTLNLARIEGGGPNNIVPNLAICHFNIRVTSEEDQAFATQHISTVLQSLQALDGFGAELHGGFTRPPKPSTPQQEKLYELVRSCSQELNLKLDFRDTGGCCDGNNLLAAGLPNIDTLGVQGGDIHSDKEYMLIDSLTRRAQLSHHILQKVATEPERWLG